MARSPAEIQADIAVTRRLVERRLDTIERGIPRGWWVPYVAAAGALAVGLVLSRVSFFRLVRVGARTTQAGLVVAQTAAMVDRYVAARRRSLA
jgi:hypothetical protein